MAGIEQHVAQGHDQAAIALLGGQADNLRLHPLALLLHAGKLGFAQGQLQALTLELKFGQALLIEDQVAVLAGNVAVALAQVGIMAHISTGPQITGQALGTGQRFTGTDHVTRRTAQHVGIVLDRLELGRGLIQRRLAALAGAALQAHYPDQQ
ncbi:hypothetical protein D3C79_657080 [compost metagenome]